METNRPPIFLLGVGAQKCGTSWLAKQLATHPQFLMSPIKEIHYWDRRFHPDFFRPAAFEKKLRKQMRENPDQVLQGPLFERYLMTRHESHYRAFFESRLKPKHRAFGEISPSYCILEPDELRYIRQMMQPYRTRALFLMRDPVDRLWSQCKMEELKASSRDRDFDAVQAFTERYADPTFERRGDYRTTIMNLDQAFPEEERHIAFFDELFEVESLAKIFDFLEIEHRQFDANDNPNKGRASSRPDPEIWDRVAAHYAPIYDFVGERMGYLPESWQASADR